MNDKTKSIIEVLYDDIVSGNKTDETNPISLAASRFFDVEICSASFGDPIQIIGLFRKDNCKYGYCLGILSFEVHEWLHHYYMDEFAPPFSFQFEHNDIEACKIKES